MQNKKNALALEDIDFPQENGVHIAGVRGFESLIAHQPFQQVSSEKVTPHTGEDGPNVPKRTAPYNRGKPKTRKFYRVTDANQHDWFWGRVAIGAPAHCWPWAGSTDRYGYGHAKHGDRTMSASRVAYILATGADVEGLLVCHRCDNPTCCNPSHLYAGTKSDNERDKFRQGGKTHRGMKNPARKLTAEQVANVRQLFQQGMTNVAIGKMLGVHHSTISKIRTGNSWDSPQESANG